MPYIKQICDIVKNKRFYPEFKSPGLGKEYYLDNPNNITIDNFISNLFLRTKKIPVLIDQVEYLLKNRRIISEALNEIKEEKRYMLIKEKMKINDVIKITQLDFIKVIMNEYELNDDNFKLVSTYQKDEDGNYYKKYVKVPLSIYAEEEAIYLCIIFEAGGLKFNTYVEIGYNYPFRYKYQNLKIKFS